MEVAVRTLNRRGTDLTSDYRADYEQRFIRFQLNQIGLSLLLLLMLNFPISSILTQNMQIFYYYHHIFYFRWVVWFFQFFFHSVIPSHA